MAHHRLPSDVRVEMDKLVKITDADVAAAAARRAAAVEEARAKFGPKVNTGPTPTTEQERKGLAFVRRAQLDWIFFRRWRLSDGWLSPKEQTRALVIFHDPLAIMMRRALTVRLYPDTAFLVEDRI